VSDNGNGPQHVPAQPSPVSFGFAKVPTADGSEVYVLELHGVNGTFVAFFDRESLLGLADQARHQVTGLQVARAPLPPPPDGTA
jgi:hypothetical protein